MHWLIEALRGVLRYVDRFFRSGWKLVALTTLALSLVLIPLLLLLPPLYTRDVTITVTPTLTELQRMLGQVEPTSAQLIGTGAVNLLRQAEEFDDEVLMDPVYEEATNRIEVHMESEDRLLMQTMDSRLVDLLETTYQRNYERDLSPVIEAVIQTLDDKAASSKDDLAEVEREIEEAPRSAGASEADIQLEERRASAATNLAAAESGKDYYEQALRDLPALSDQAVAVRLVDETPVQPKGTRGSAVAAALLLAFVVAIAGALRMGYARGK